MHLQTVCILFALLIVLVLFLVSRSEGFEEKVAISAPTAPASSVTTTQKPNEPVGNSSLLKTAGPTLSPMPISTLQPTLQLRQSPNVSQSPNISQSPNLSNSMTGSLSMDSFVTGPSREEQREQREEEEREKQTQKEIEKRMKGDGHMYGQY